MPSKMPKPGELEPIETASRDEVAALQLQRLQWSLKHAYDNVPQASARKRSPRHEGVCWLELDVNAAPSRLRGQYYSDRGTTGDVDLVRTGTEIVTA